MNCHDAVVFRHFLRECEKFVFLAVAVRFVHEPKRPAERSAFHRLVHVLFQLFDLIRCKRSIVVSGHPCAYGAVSDQRRHVDIEIPLGSFLEIRKRTRMKTVKQSSSDLVPVRRVLPHTERRERTVPGNLRRDSLFDKWLVEFLRILAVIEEIVVRMRVNQTRTNLVPFNVQGFIGFLLDQLRNLPDPVVFNQYVPAVRRVPRTVDNPSVFKQCFHSVPPLYETII